MNESENPFVIPATYVIPAQAGIPILLKPLETLLVLTVGDPSMRWDDGGARMTKEVYARGGLGSNTK